MSQPAIILYPPDAPVDHPATRWVEWFNRYIDRREQRQRKRRSQQQFAAIDARTLRDIGISPAQRFIAVNDPFGE